MGFRGVGEGGRDSSTQKLKFWDGFQRSWGSKRATAPKDQEHNSQTTCKSSNSKPKLVFSCCNSPPRLVHHRRKPRRHRRALFHRRRRHTQSPVQLHCASHQAAPPLFCSPPHQILFGHPPLTDVVPLLTTSSAPSSSFFAAPVCPCRLVTRRDLPCCAHDLTIITASLPPHCRLLESLPAPRSPSCAAARRPISTTERSSHLLLCAAPHRYALLSCPIHCRHKLPQDHQRSS